MSRTDYESGFARLDSATLARQLDELARVTVDVVHDMSNVLTIIGAHADSLATELSPHSSNRGSVDAIVSAADRATAVLDRLRVLLRNRRRPAANEPAALPRPVAAGRNRTVLVVDDDREVRALMVDVLRRQGYAVVDAASADAAVGLCEMHDVQLLVVDIHLEGVRGDHLAAALVDERPGLGVIFVSGYPDECPLQDRALVNASFLQKPFSAGDLVSRVEALLL